MLLSTLAAATLALAPLGIPVAAAQPCTPVQAAAGLCTPAPVTTTTTPPTSTTPPPATTTTALPTTAPMSRQDAAIAQLCVATSIAEVDDALADLTESDLVGRLGGLLDIVVIDDADNITAVGAVQPGDVRRALNCDPDDTTAPTTTAPPAGGGGGGAGDGDGDDGAIGGDGNGGSSVIPSGAPQTGGRPPADSPLPLILAALLAPAAVLARIRAARG